MEKQVHKINGFVDLGSAKVGQRLLFVDDNGQWRQTSTITNAQVAGNKIMVETANSIYMNYDPVIDIAHDSFRMPYESDLQQSEQINENQTYGFRQPTFDELNGTSVEQLLAEKYCDSDKHKYVITDYEKENFKVYHNDTNTWEPIDIENIEKGMSIGFGYCAIQDMETGKSGVINGFIREVQDCACKDGVFCIESRSAVFSNVDFSRELAQAKTELSKECQMDIGREV